MRLPTNVFKTALTQSAGVQIGLWVGMADPTAAEIAAAAGFDWLLIDGEHAPNDLRSTLDQLRAVNGYSTSAIVRPPRGDAASIKQLLDIGAQTLLIPMVNSAEQAEALVSATRYPPRGIRGVGGARAARWGLVDEYWRGADDSVCLILQIESLEALDNIEAIAAVDGVDALFVGPSDLAAAMGHLGDVSHPDVLDAVTTALRRIRAAGKPGGVLALQPEATRAYTDAGASFVAVGVDTLLLSRAARQLAVDYSGSDELNHSSPTTGSSTNR